MGTGWTGTGFECGALPNCRYRCRMIMAELEVYHSRPVAPTRRVALGRMTLPADPPPGFGGILLGGIVATHVNSIDPDLLPDLLKLTVQLENGMRIPQPRLRFRFQKDYVGLQRSTHRLLGEGDALRFAFDDDHGLPAQQLLGAVYAAGQLPPRVRPAVLSSIRRAVGWQGPVGPELISVLAGFNSGSSFSSQALGNPVEWALDVLGFEEGGGRAVVTGRNGHVTAGATAGARDARADPAGPAGTADRATATRTTAGPSKVEIQQRFRRLLIDAHPDHGGRIDGAAQRIADLTEARKILLG